MFDLRISGLVEAKALAWWPSHTLSLVDPGAVVSTGDNHRVIEFADTENIAAPHAPTRHQIDDILDFTKDLTLGDRLLVHCFAGIRRSTAAAIGVLIARGRSIETAFEHVYAIRSCMLPNMLVLRHFDDTLDLCGRLVAHGRHWIDASMSDRIRTEVARSMGDSASDAALRVQEMKRLMGAIK